MKMIKAVDNKRMALVYSTIASWLVMYFLGLEFNVSFASLAVYFLSLTGFVASYIWGETIRPSDATSVFRKGKSSNREIMIYVCVVLWLGVGIYGIMKHASMEQLSAYYSALTPFVSTYILGSSYKPASLPGTPNEKKPELDIQAVAPLADAPIIDSQANPL